MNSYDLERKIIDLLLVLNGTKKMYRTEKAARHYLEKNRTLNDLPYRVPAQVKRDWEEISIDGIQCLTRKGKTETTIFYLHGGAYFLRPIKFHFMMLDDLAKATGFNIILPLYPLAPNHTFLEAYDKIQSVYEKSLSHLDIENVILMGDSAGGGLALGLLQSLAKQHHPTPKKLLLISPFLDITMTNPEIPVIEPVDRMLGSRGLREIGSIWANGTDPKDERLSPIYGDLSCIDSIMITTGTHDILNPDAVRLKNRLIKDQKWIVYLEEPKLPHDFPLLPMRKARNAKSEMIKYLLAETR
jgi:acetyl esterase/lipase